MYSNSVSSVFLVHVRKIRHCTNISWVKWDFRQETLMLRGPSETQERQLTETSRSRVCGCGSGQQCAALAHCADATHSQKLAYTASDASQSQRILFFRWEVYLYRSTQNLLEIQKTDKSNKNLIHNHNAHGTYNTGKWQLVNYSIIYCSITLNLRLETVGTTE